MHRAQANKEIHLTAVYVKHFLIRNMLRKEKISDK